MTKLKSKKMTKSTFAVIIMAILMVAMLAFGGTYAWFTATTKTIGGDAITTGKIILNAGGSFTASTSVMPGDSLLKDDADITMEAGAGTDSRGEYVAVKLVVTIATLNGTDTAASLITVAPATGWKQVGNVALSDESKTATYYFAYATADDAITALTTNDGAKPVFSAITFSAEDNWTQSSTETATTASDKGYMGTTITLTLNAKGTQVANRDGANAIATTTDLVEELFEVELA